MSITATAAEAQYSAPVGQYDTNDVYNFSLLGDGRRSYADMQRDRQIEQQYRQTVAKIPDKKGSGDPWHNIRPAPNLTAEDRHRVY